jgi:hypothetical protein
MITLLDIKDHAKIQEPARRVESKRREEMETREQVRHFFLVFRVVGLDKRSKGASLTMPWVIRRSGMAELSVDLVACASSAHFESTLSHTQETRTLYSKKYSSERDSDSLGVLFQPSSDPLCRFILEKPNSSSDKSRRKYLR